MKEDILVVIDTGYDDSTGFYVNGTKTTEVHCNDRHEIPDVLYDLMVKYNFSAVYQKQLSDTGYSKYQSAGYNHPTQLTYSDEDFQANNV